VVDGERADKETGAPDGCCHRMQLPRAWLSLLGSPSTAPKSHFYCKTLYIYRSNSTDCAAGADCGTSSWPCRKQCFGAGERAARVLCFRGMEPWSRRKLVPSVACVCSSFLKKQRSMPVWGSWNHIAGLRVCLDDYQSWPCQKIG
jgi:hypothetical protein